MLKIGLTGGIASGKSTVCNLFERYKTPIIDADRIARELVAPQQKAYDEICQLFGQGILLNNGEVDRNKLRKIIFSDINAKQQLEEILHPKIRKQLILETHQQHAPYIILAIPLLIEAKMTDLVDRIVVVDTTLDLQRERLSQRDNSSKDQIESILNAQCSRAQRRQYADDIINNNSDLISLEQQVKQLHLSFLKLADSCQQSNSQGQ